MPDRPTALRDSLTYLTTSDDWPRTVVIGGVLVLFGVLVAPAVLAVGYLVRVLRAAMADDDPPAFDDWGDLASDGVWVTVIGLTYVTVFAVTTLMLAGTVAAVGGEGAGSAVAVLFMLAAGGTLAYVLPAAVVGYAERGTVQAGFEAEPLRAAVSTRAYAETWLWIAAVVLATGVVAGILGVVPLLGAVAGAVVCFYGAVVATHYLGESWDDVREADPADSVAAIGWTAVHERVHGTRSENGDALSAGVRDLVDVGAVRERIGGSGDADPADPADPVAWEATAATGAGGDSEDAAVVADGDDPGVDAAATPSVEDVAARPIGTFDAADVDALVSGLDADDPETVVTATRLLAETAGERPALLADSDAMARLRDLRLSEESTVRGAATRAVRRFEAAGLS